MKKIGIFVLLCITGMLLYLVCVHNVVELEPISFLRTENNVLRTFRHYEPYKELQEANIVGTFYEQMNDTSTISVKQVTRIKYSAPKFGPARWASMPGEVLDVYVLSAFWDDRWQGYVKPVISVLAALHNNPGTAAKPSHINCICQCSDIHETYIISTEVERYHGWFDNTYMHKRFGSYIIMCDIQEHCVPDLIMLSYSDNIPHLTVNNSVPVEYPEKDMKYDFGLCVPISFGNIDPYRLIEWLEFQKILGISWVGIYDASLGNSTRKLLQQYQRENFVFMNRNEAILYPSQRMELRIRCSIAITDCLYRHMYNTKYIVINDFDEAIVPTNNFTLQEMMSHIEKMKDNHNIAQANFRNTFFILDDLIMESPADESVFNQSTFLKYRHRLEHSPAGWHTKSIINPRGCALMHNHFCHHPIHEYRRGAPKHNKYSVPTALGKNVHYRHNVCRMKKGHLKCYDKLSPNITRPDNTLLKYKTQLVNNLKKVLKHNGLSYM